VNRFALVVTGAEKFGAAKSEGAAVAVKSRKLKAES